MLSMSMQRRKSTSKAVVTAKEKKREDKKIK